MDKSKETILLNRKNKSQKDTKSIRFVTILKTYFNNINHLRIPMHVTITQHMNVFIFQCNV